MISNCTLIQVDRDAFVGLTILIELDLSYNQIKIIHPGTFHPLLKIRKILLHDNELTAISDRTFENLQHLSHVELKNNKIHFVGEQAFLNVPLKTIYLANNRLQKLEKTTFMSLTHLSALSLGGNMWNCSCELKDFRNFVIDKKLTTDTKCHYPDALRDKPWTDVGEDEFACKPRILMPRGSAYVRASKENETLVCQVRGSPRPNVEWLFGNRLVRENDRYKVRTFESMGSIKKDEHLRHVVSELTIVGLRMIDHGKYVCKATNKGGQDEFAIQLEIPADYTKGGSFVPPSTNTFFMILCIIVGVLFILLFTIAILCCYCRRVSKYDKKPSSDNALLMSQQNGPTTKLNGKAQSDSMLDGGSVIMEMQKSLLTEVNPVEKPPRRTEVDSIEKDSDDISDVKQTLLDETIFGKFKTFLIEKLSSLTLLVSFLTVQHDDETRSIQMSDTTQPRSRQAFIDDGYGGNLLPPDLLAFPRFPQSPSIQSSISNIHDTRIYGRSPLTSPVYGETTIPSSGFRTLQHPKNGRSFVPAPIVYPTMMKQGYVTIPRKQRTGSWAPSVASDFQTSPGSPPLEYAEPVYDNLGLRTTAAGNSILNLNKIALGLSKSGGLTSPGANLKYSMKDRPLPATPASLNGDQKKSNGVIREPLYSSATMERKVPPRPPPKPLKKKPVLESSFNDSTGSQPLRITNGSHFEDEGEDGTEV